MCFAQSGEHAVRRLVVLTSFVAGLATALLYRHDMKRTRVRLKAAGTVANTSFGPIDFAELGDGAPVLVLHGTGGGFDQGLDMTAALADEGFRLIAPSRFGYLRSSLPRDTSAAAQADASAELLDGLGVERCAVIGISAGAWPALHFAVRYPARCSAVVLLVPATDLPCKTRLLGRVLSGVFACDFLAWAMVRLGCVFAALRGPMVGTPARVVRRANPKEKRRVRSILFDALPGRARLAGMRVDLGQMSPDSACALADVACPVLAISAEDDAFETAGRAREVAAAVPDGTVVIYSSGGHALVNRYSQAVRETAMFLKRERS
jgi:2-hydroxy-6-oxonona-2,4-dienedioate hydrolase